ncbi:MAG: HrpE/YscL family type III secretion apparatus protein [Verrucomicrobia bacterium CG_4_10_14_3_um_filter_43_23]|nr:MAG: hypothetical protein AUJ82_07710 [Verrucomicrobia bacterium CG1_02_43_26]PIP58658.1 MAG: HrpE/YscL family type III secretion apparatus protein [Verrucomicrobia bacterium CG22_combo_CG10-13_8_21_14_all_43_17]PIX58520.1 MAG: HrpE/YscL family type III secretion apparatus protein [Verrucomicrobia bacterium CG_4_10_14_3_um_filter_43_23]PIY61252.1 MAG: HrpE/YscL family type III secretion apparatus protein [Verrucomicrobia bacterium CG_4_10_14_0_8_um_filter_43_34]PJA43560.1 MAG: HrpE/YscL fami
MFCLKEDQFYPEPGKKIIKKEEYAIFLNANQIVEEAQKKAARIVEEAKQAYADEKKRGFNEGMAEGNKKISELMIESVSKSLKNFENFENDIIQVVMQALKKIVGELNADELIIGIVKNALAMVRDQKKVTLIVSPSQEKVVREKLDEIMKGYPTISFIQLDRDPRLKEGGCLLVTEMGMVDATLEIQLEAIQKSLKRVIK